MHPQSMIHAMVRLDDGSVLAHCGPPDMKVPIGYALRHPAPPPPGAPMDLVGRTLEFEAPDEAAFPCLALAREAGRAGGTAPAVLNAANEVAVAAFLDGRCGFMDIARVVRAALEAVPAGRADELEAVLAADARARAAAADAIEGCRRVRPEHPLVRPDPDDPRAAARGRAHGRRQVVRHARRALLDLLRPAPLVVPPRRDRVRHRLAARWAAT